jgi:hypothetical protein
MFVRNVALRLRPNRLDEFKRAVEIEILPLLRTQSGFRDLITFAMTGGADVIAISLWDSREQAEAYQTAVYPQVMTSLNPVLDGSPKLRVADIVSSTLHTNAQKKQAAIAAA